MTTNVASVARRFAVALDAEDYATAQALLADACVYLCRGQRYSGPAAIIAAYQCTGTRLAKKITTFHVIASLRPNHKSR